MKRINARKALSEGMLICSTLFLTSCSSMWLERGQSVDSVLDSSTQKNQGTVSKQQYDELAKKYSELLDKVKNQNGVEEVKVADHNLVLNDGQIRPQVIEETVIDPSELVSRIDSAIPDAPKFESKDPINSPQNRASIEALSSIKKLNQSDEIDEEISRLRQAQELIKVNKFEQALIILHDLQNSKEKQIVVRSKMMLGDLLFVQNEFDLASQVYEEIIGKYAFSGFVVKALGKLVVCSEKLKQPEKQAKYYSLLHDFFEAG